jgi:hypothetical protein
MVDMKKNLRLSYIEWIPVLIGISWAIWQWKFERGLWLDEASLGLNLLNRNLRELLQPLDFGQAAPALYLLITKLSALAFGPGVLSMRFPSLLCYIVSVILFMQILRRTIDSLAARIVGISMFCFNLILLRFSGELKQYMMETMVCIVITYLTLRLIENDGKKPWTLLFFGMISIPLSHTAMVVLGMSGIMMIYLYLKTRNSAVLKTILLCGLSWLATLLVYYVLFIRNHPLQPFMKQYWTKVGGFGPAELFSAASLQFLTTKLAFLLKAKYIFTPTNAAYNWSILLIPLAFGLWGALRRKPHLVFLSIPLILHFCLSYLHIYPFEFRLALYLVPLVILSAAIGVDEILGLVRLNRNWTGGIMLVLCLWQGWLFRKKYLPIRSEELKTVATVVSKQIQPAEKVWINPDARYAFDYYHQIGAYQFAATSIVKGEPVEKGGSYDQQIVKLQSDTWLLLTHMEKKEVGRIIQKLKASGYKVVDSSFAPSAYGYLVEPGGKQ